MLCNRPLKVWQWVKKCTIFTSNAYNIKWFLLLTKFSPPVNLLPYIISSLFKLIIILAPLMLSHLLVHLPPRPLRSRNRSFQYVSPHLWNKLPFSLREPVSPLYAYLNPSFSSPLSPSITPSLFYSKVKTYLFVKSFPHRSFTIDTSDWLLG